MVETVGDVLQRPAKGYFMTVHVRGEVEGEVERSFYEDFRTELGHIWRLYDSSGLQLSVEFNNDDDVPRITTGWMTLRRHYNFHRHHPIFFKYLGNNQFQIIAKENPITPDKFPTWHTKTRALRKVVTFAITMTEDPEVVPYLVDIA
ncbi:hypothetical protein A2U01_0006375 [Trifolium medium]|uniref:Uncharacterized protein n=2 Tax=Trifolium medium TaxID=97028 RepID=A0A392MEQ8_9FABA|nr:hypothetical protein [Trifolium medium]